MPSICTLRTAPQAVPPPLSTREASISAVRRVVVLDFNGDSSSGSAALLESLQEFGSAGTQITVVSEGGAPQGWNKASNIRCLLPPTAQRQQADDMRQKQGDGRDGGGACV